MDDTKRDIYDRLRSVENTISESNARYDVMIEQNGQLITLLKTALKYGFYVIMALMLIVAYGAIGREGFNAVSHLTKSEVVNG